MSVTQDSPPLIAAEGVSRTVAGRSLFDSITLAIGEGERVGLLGANGAGKTTLLRILAGLEPPESGRVTRRRGLRVAVLAQEAALDAGRTVAEELRAGQADLRAAIAALHALDEELAAERDAARRARLLERRAAREHEIETLGGHDPDRALQVVASALGLPPGERICGTLSGGERRRVALARALVANPDVLLLDEPTNHLDAETIDWLEGHLLASRSSALIVTHDRFFLDRVVSRIVEIDGGRLHETRARPGEKGGLYARFLEQRDARVEREEATETARRAYLRAELLWLASGVKAQRRKGKERVERVKDLEREIGAKPRIAPELQFRIPSGPRLGQKVVELRDVAKSLGGRRLFEGLTLRLAAGDRLGVVGRNGAGKSTLLRVIMGEEKPDRGAVEIGPNTRFSYVDQARATLDPEKTILEEVAGDSPWVTIGDETITVRAYLTRFLFAGGRQQERIRTLSGGERSRVAIAKLLRAGGNVVLLDEPTNDLDLATLRVLEEALVRFEGTAVIVSHDRWFLERTATRTLGLEGDGRFAIVEGGYEAYREARAAAAAPPRAAEPAAGKRPARTLTAKEKRELDDMERSIEAAEADAARTSKALEDPGLYADPARREEARRLAAELEAARARVAALYARWEELERRRAGGP